MRISDWSSDVCSSDLGGAAGRSPSSQSGGFKLAPECAVVIACRFVGFGKPDLLRALAAVAGKVADDHPCVRAFLRPEDTKRDIARHAAFDVAAEIAFAAILRDCLPTRAAPGPANDLCGGPVAQHGKT